MIRGEPGLAVIVVGALWIMERRRAAHLADQLRVEREALQRSTQMIQQLLDTAEGAPGPTAPPVDDAP